MKGIIRLKITDLLLFKKNSNKRIACKKCTNNLHLFANGFDAFFEVSQTFKNCQATNKLKNALTGCRF